MNKGLTGVMAIAAVGFVYAQTVTAVVTGTIKKIDSEGKTIASRVATSERLVARWP